MRAREVRLALTTADRNLLREMHIAPPIVPPEENRQGGPGAIATAVERGQRRAEAEKREREAWQATSRMVFCIYMGGIGATVVGLVGWWWERSPLATVLIALFVLLLNCGLGICDWKPAPRHRSSRTGDR